MAEVKKGEGLVYKNHPLRRVDNLIYYGSMADEYIVMLQKDGERQSLCRHGCGLHLAGARPGRKISSAKAPEGGDSGGTPRKSTV